MLGLRTYPMLAGSQFLASGEMDSTLNVEPDPDFSPDLLLAGILDAYRNNSPHSSSSLTRFLGSGRAANFRQALGSLTSIHRDALRENLGGGTFEELLSISHNENPEMFFEALLNLGRRAQSREQIELAGLIFSSVNQVLEENFPGRSETLANVGARAGRQLDILMGRGDWRDRLVPFLGSLIREVASPIGLASMAGAGLAYQGVRFATFSRLAGISRWPLLTRGIGAHLTASTIGLGAEISAFMGIGRGLRTLAGYEQDWGLGALGEEFARTGLMLTGLKTFGAGSRFLLGRMPTMATAGIGARSLFLHQLPHRIIPQMGMFAGIMSAYKIEEWTGLRDPGSFSNLAGEAFGTLIHFYAVGKMLNYLPARYHQVQQDYVRRSEILRQQLFRGVHRRFPPSGGSPLSLGWRLAVPEGEIALNEVREPLRIPQNMHMENNGEGNGNENGGTRPGVGKPPQSGREVSEDLAGRDTDQDPRSESLASPIPPPPPDSSREGPETIGSAQTEIQIQSDRPPPSGLARDLAETLDSPEQIGGHPNGLRDALESQPGQLTPGMRIGPDGKYEILRHLGEGGMGAVYQVRELGGLGRNAVIKVNKNPELVGRFVQEYRIGANMTTSRKVTVYELIEEGGITIPVMEFIPGIDLSEVAWGVRNSDPEVLRTYPMEVRLEIFAKICEAVSEIHRDGVLHRDLKPDNIRLTGWPAILAERLREAREEGRPEEEINSIEEMFEVERERPLEEVRIMDLGISKPLHQVIAEDRENGIRGPVRTSMLPPRLDEGPMVKTRAGTTPGTLGYIAPELFSPNMFPSRNPTSSDLFSLGVILYELATGYHPFASYRRGGGRRTL